MEKIAKSKKIGILTFHASHNYGSMIQAYALQHILQMRGYDSEIINLRTKIQKGLIKPEIDFSHLKTTFIKIIKHPKRTIALQRKYNCFEHFLTSRLVCSKELHTHAEVEKYIKEVGFETIIVGSDQIWNTFCWDFDRSYLLDFNFPIKRIAYAPSLGTTPEKICGNDLELLRRTLTRFDCLSTREKRGSEFVSNLVGRDCEVVLDPTLLLDKGHYDELLDAKPIIKTDYIFYYTPREESGTFRMAQLLSKKLGYKIVVTQSHPDYVGENVVHLNSCGPKEFLNVIRNASYTVGNSFHLLAFSIIFHRQFLLVSREDDSRMMNLLKPLGLENRLVNIATKSVNLPENIDFSKVDEVMNREKQKSLNYLCDSLS